MTDITKEELDGYKNDLLLGCKIPDSVIYKICTLTIRGLEAQWRPIDQAPKDGTGVLGFAKGEYGCFMHTMYWVTEDSSFKKLETPFWYWPFAINPTHFIPLSALGEPK